MEIEPVLVGARDRAWLRERLDLTVGGVEEGAGGGLGPDQALSPCCC